MQKAALVDMATLPKFAETKVQQGLEMGTD